MRMAHHFPICISVIRLNLMIRAIIMLLVDLINGKKKLLRDHHPGVVGKQFEKSIERFLNDKPAIGFQKKFNSSTPPINI